MAPTRNCQYIAAVNIVKYKNRNIVIGSVLMKYNKKKRVSNNRMTSVSFAVYK